jgi:hypothetical protein
MHVYLGLANYELLIVTSSTVGFVCLYTKKFDGKADHCWSNVVVISRCRREHFILRLNQH